MPRDAADSPDAATSAGPVPRGLSERRRGVLAQVALVVVLGGVYLWTLLPGPGHSHDTVEAQFAAPFLCVAHPSGSPTYLLLGHLFSRLVPLGTLAWRMNLLSALFGVLACLVIRLLLRRLGVREILAWTTAVAFGLTPTFWRFSVVAEVYSLNLLFVALVSDALVKWRQTLRDRHLLLACAWYVASFGNHLTMATLLPAFVFFVLATRWRVVTRWKLVGAVSGLILLGLLPFSYAIVRSLDPDTPYLYCSVTTLARLWGYTTGADFSELLVAHITPGQLVARLPLFLPFFWNDCAAFLPLAAVGLWALSDRVTVVYLGLLSLGHLVFALGFECAEAENYYIPIYFATAVLAGIGLERIISSRVGRRLPAVLCLALPLALGIFNRAEVEQAKRPKMAEPMRQLLLDSREGALIIARYNDLMQLLYYSLGEGLGGPWVFLASDVPVPDIVAYVRDDQPLYSEPTRKRVPPGLPVYSTRLRLRPELRAAGLWVRMVRPGVFRIARGPVDEDE